MRIIAGTARSLPLKTIEGLETRPTTDKIKETLFNMLQNDVPGCYFLDLFAGSGQIGLEAISRGALYAVFIENNRKAAKCIEDNIAFTKFTKESRLLTTDVISGISSLEGKYTFDIIFMDPPYCQVDEIYQLLEMISEKEILAVHGKLVIETEKSVIMPLVKNKLTCYKSKKYGITTISYYSRENYEFENCSLPREL